MKKDSQKPDWEEKLLALRCVNYNMYIGSGRDACDNCLPFDLAVDELKSFVSSERQRLIEEVREKVKKVMDEYEDNYFGSYIKKKILDQIKST